MNKHLVVLLAVLIMAGVYKSYRGSRPHAGAPAESQQPRDSAEPDSRAEPVIELLVGDRDGKNRAKRKFRLVGEKTITAPAKGSAPKYVSVTPPTKYVGRCQVEFIISDTTGCEVWLAPNGDWTRKYLIPSQIRDDGDVSHYEVISDGSDPVEMRVVWVVPL